MTTQVSFTADRTLKNKALEKAKSEGITLKALLVYAMKGFVDGKIKLGIETSHTESDVEEIFFDDKRIHEKAAKISKFFK